MDIQKKTTEDQLLFKDVNLSDSSDGSIADGEDECREDVSLRKKKAKKKTRKKIFFRSDFVEGEESSSENDESKEKKSTIEIDPADLSWLMWLWYYVVFASSTTLHAAEYCGEKLADFFGITAPKYQYAIAEYHRLKQEEEEDEAAERFQCEVAHREELNVITTMEGGSPPNNQLA